MHDRVGCMCGWKTYNSQSVCSCRRLFVIGSSIFHLTIRKNWFKSLIVRQGGWHESKCCIVQGSSLRLVLRGTRVCKLALPEENFYAPHIYAEECLPCPDGFVSSVAAASCRRPETPIFIDRSWGTVAYTVTIMLVSDPFNRPLLLLCFLLSTKSTDDISTFWIAKLIMPMVCYKGTPTKLTVSRVKNISWRQRKTRFRHRQGFRGVKNFESRWWAWFLAFKLAEDYHEILHEHTDSLIVYARALHALQSTEYH